MNTEPVWTYQQITERAEKEITAALQRAAWADERTRSAQHAHALGAYSLWCAIVGAPAIDSSRLLGVVRSIGEPS